MGYSYNFHWFLGILAQDRISDLVIVNASVYTEIDNKLKSQQVFLRDSNFYSISIPLTSTSNSSIIRIF